uniref:Uncharacterized protein n=1 Tax=Candidatus Methanophaga sp. ANME-1 ERB7 TaxID=2759913 RepID=A0A7G9ZBF3_9EURY|nr:hypothetical protein GIFCIIHN_00003 [Methanosarcinales archaeon ANME-1 ERB7]
MGNETNATEPMVMAMDGNGSGVVDNIHPSMMMAMSMCMNMSGIMDENTSVNTNGNACERQHVPICQKQYVGNRIM